MAADRRALLDGVPAPAAHTSCETMVGAGLVGTRLGTDVCLGFLLAGLDLVRHVSFVGRTRRVRDPTCIGRRIQWGVGDGNARVGSGDKRQVTAVLYGKWLLDTTRLLRHLHVDL